MSHRYTCMVCGAEVPDLGPMRTKYRCDECIYERRTLRGSSTVERRAHYPTVAGSTPAPATKCCMFCGRTGVHECPGGEYTRELLGTRVHGRIFPGLVDADAFPADEVNE